MARETPTRIIGIDFGMVRLGLAVSDERKIVGMPYKTIQADRKLELTIEKLVLELQAHQKELGYEIAEIVIGLPLLMNGKKGHIADEVNLFVEELKKKCDKPIVLWDERLTSVLAERSLMESSMSRKKRTKHLDTVSAVIILQNYLDSKNL